MITRFAPLLTLGVTHAYNAGPSFDFEFLLPEDTAALVRGRRLVARTLSDLRLHVGFEADESGVARADPGGVTLRVGLRLLNPWFDNVTALAERPLGSILVYRNSPDPRKLGPPATLRLVGPVFSHTLGRSERPATVSLVRGDETLRALTATAGVASVAFDARGIAPGALRIDERYPGGARPQTDAYLDGDLQRQGVLAVVEITIDDAFPAQAPALELSFTAREETLKYYVVASNYTAAELDQLSVQDMGFTEQKRGEVRFSKVPESAFSAQDTPPALLGVSGARVVLFKSQAKVARRADARRRIELRRNGEALVDSLPQPGARAATADVVVHVSKPKRT